MFDPLDHPGIPVDHHGRHWHDFDVEPVDTRATDPNALRRISMVAAVEANAEHFDRQSANRVQDGDARRSASGVAVLAWVVLPIDVGRGCCCDRG